MDRINVRWSDECHTCKAPIGVKLTTDRMRTLTNIVMFSCAHPLDLSLNYHVWKRDICKLNRFICTACHMNITNIPNHLMDREITGKFNTKLHRSVSKSELYNWFEKVERALKNKDYDWEQLVDHKPNMKNIRLFKKNTEYDILI